MVALLTVKRVWIRGLFKHPLCVRTWCGGPPPTRAGAPGATMQPAVECVNRQAKPLYLPAHTIPSPTPPPAVKPYRPPHAVFAHSRSRRSSRHPVQADCERANERERKRKKQGAVRRGAERSGAAHETTTTTTTTIRRDDI